MLSGIPASLQHTAQTETLFAYTLYLCLLGVGQNINARIYCITSSCDTVAPDIDRFIKTCLNSVHLL